MMQPELGEAFTPPKRTMSSAMLLAASAAALGASAGKGPHPTPRRAAARRVNKRPKRRSGSQFSR